MKSRLSNILLVGVLLVIAAPFVISAFYPGNNLFFHWQNNDNATDGNAVLLLYGDTNGCSDTDNGFKPSAKGTLTWVDGNTTYVQSDYCDSNTTLIELNCVKDITVNGVQYQNYMMASRFNCQDINATGVCMSALARCS